MAMLITYTRIDPTDLYHVLRDGVVGGVSRTLVAVNFPFALITIALVLVALEALSTRAWWIGTPAIVLCAIAAVPVCRGCCHGLRSLQRAGRTSMSSS